MVISTHLPENPSTLHIRQATKEDAPLVLEFIQQLAKYQKAEHQVTASIDDIRTHIGSHSTHYNALLCFDQQVAIGFAVYFFNFSTWTGKLGLFIEDLFVKPDYRRHGAGREIFRHLASIAHQKGCVRMDWNVLDWNESAQHFYQSIGAKPMHEWVGFRLEQKAIQKLKH